MLVNLPNTAVDSPNQAQADEQKRNTQPFAPRIRDRLILTILLFTLLSLVSYRLLYQGNWLLISIIAAILMAVSVPNWHLELPRPDSLRNLLMQFADFCLAIQWQEWITLTLIPLALIQLNANQPDFSLRHFQDRTIGISVVEGVDVGARSKIVIASLGLGLGALGLILVALFLLIKGWHISSSHKLRLRDRLYLVHYLSIVLLSINLLVDADVFAISTYYLLFQVIILISALYPALRYSLGLHPGVINVLSLAGLITAVSLRGKTSGLSASQDAMLPLIILLTVVISIHLIPYLITHFSRRSSQIARAVAMACIPLILLPTTSFFADEIGYALFRRFGWVTNLDTLTGNTIVFFLIMAGILFGIGLKRAPRISTTVRYLAYPSVLVSLAVMVLYQAPTTDFKDWFHFGELIMPAHQLVNFGSIPYVDILPTHGLFWVALSLIDYGLNGWIGTDTAYFVQVTSVSISLIIGYWFLTRVLKQPTFALVLSILLPGFIPWWSWSLSGYALALLTYLPLAALLRDPTRRNAWTLGFWLAALILILRLDAILIIVATTVVLLTLRFALNPKQVRSVVIPIVLPLILELVIYLLVLIARLGVPHGLARISLILKFISVDFQSMTSGLVPVFSPDIPKANAFLIMYGLPILLILLAVPLGLRLLSKVLRKESLDQLPIIALALVGFALIWWLRDFQRHSQFEQGISAGTLGLLPLAILMCVYALKPSSNRLIAGAALLTMILAWTSTPFTFPITPALDVHLFPDKPEEEIVSEAGSRFNDVATWYSDPSSLTTIDTFLKENLQPGQSAAYFGWNIQLYTVWNTKIPGFYIPALYTAGDSVQAEYIANLDPDDYPYVILTAPVWSVDSVADPIRSYRVFEHIYTHYTPLMRVGNLAVFGPTDATPMPNTHELFGIESFDLYDLPRIWAGHDPLDALGKATVTYPLFDSSAEPANERPITIEPDAVHSFELHDNYRGQLGDYLLLHASSAHEAQQPAKLRIKYDINLSSKPINNMFTLNIESEPQDYLLRLSIQYGWLAGDRIYNIHLMNESQVPLVITYAAIVNAP